MIGGVPYAAAASVEALFEAPETTTTEAPTTTTTEETTSTEASTSTSTEETTPTETTEATTTTTEKTQETTSTSAATTTTTNGTILGPGTTENKGDRVALNVSLDHNVLTAFGVKESVFQNKARLLLTKDDYTNLTDCGANQLMLNVLTAKKLPTEEQLAAAIGATSQFATEEEFVSLTFDLSFLKLNQTTGKILPVSALPLNTTYVVELPVPADMQDAKQLAITFFDGDQLMQPIPLEVQGGCFSLEINSLEAYTLIAFGAEKGVGGGSNSVLLIVLLVVGILLLAAAAFLVFFFVLRKPEPKKVNEAPVFVPDLLDENDIFSGRDDLSEINRRPTDNK